MILIRMLSVNVPSGVFEVIGWGALPLSQLRWENMPPSEWRPAPHLQARNQKNGGTGPGWKNAGSPIRG
jgi:hypothetical protein